MIKEGPAIIRTACATPSRSPTSFDQQSRRSDRSARRTWAAGLQVSFYGRENAYRYFPGEGTYITCRGPWFSPSFDRYLFGLSGVEGSINVIVPKTIAAGTPWVFRADHVSRDAAVDLALLEQGFTS